MTLEGTGWIEAGLGGRGGAPTEPKEDLMGSMSSPLYSSFFGLLTFCFGVALGFTRWDEVSAITGFSS
jgi:hypothetical protein